MVPILFILLALASGVVPLLLRRKFANVQAEDETKEAANSVVLRIATLHALILALVFADGQLALRRQQQAIKQEAAKILYVAYMLERYESPEAARIQHQLTEFAHIVSMDEWIALSRSGQMSKRAWDIFNDIFDQVLVLEPAGIRQETFYRELIATLRQIGEYRHSRAFHAQNVYPKMFWVIAIIGFVLIAALYSVFRPSRSVVAIILSFSLMMGLVLYVIFEFSYPYSGVIHLSETPYEISFQETQKLLMRR